MDNWIKKMDGWLALKLISRNDKLDGDTYIYIYQQLLLGMV